MLGVGAAAFGGRVDVSIIHDSVHYYHSTAVPNGITAPSRLGRLSAAVARMLRSSGQTGPAGGGLEAIGIGVLGSVRGQVINNVSQAAQGAGPGRGQAPWLQAGIWVSPDAVGGTSRPVTIRGNLVRRAEDGILLQGTQGLKVLANRVSNTVGAIVLLDSTGGLVSGNSARGRKGGIFVDSSSTGNALRSNKAYSSAGVACGDESSGPGTAGTGNTWSGNSGASSSPAGLCSAP
jgi:parallel beta-helix repeat protein